MELSFFLFIVASTQASNVVIITMEVIVLKIRTRIRIFETLIPILDVILLRNSLFEIDARTKYCIFKKRLKNFIINSVS